MLAFLKYIYVIMTANFKMFILIVFSFLVCEGERNKLCFINKVYLKNLQKNANYKIKKREGDMFTEK